MNEITSNTYYLEGKRHFEENGDELSNPYEAGTEERSLFERGGSKH